MRKMSLLQSKLASLLLAVALLVANLHVTQHVAFDEEGLLVPDCEICRLAELPADEAASLSLLRPTFFFAGRIARQAVLSVHLPYVSLYFSRAPPVLS